MNILCRKYILCNKRFWTSSACSFSVASFFRTIEKDDVYDKVDNDSESQKEETGWDRLRNMFSYDKYGMPSPQLNLILESTCFSFLAGLIFGGINYGQEAYFQFIEENKLSTFPNHFEAKRRLQDKVMTAYLKGGLKVGLRLSLISTTLMLIMISLSTYRGSLSLPEFVAAGALTGAVYKFKEGPKPMVAGGVGGAILGTVGGAVVVGLMKLTGITVQDLHLMDADRIKKYSENKKAILEKQREAKLDPNLQYRREATELASDADKKV